MFPILLQLDDDRLRQHIINSLSAREIPGVENLDLQVVRGSVRLQGSLPSLYEKARCMECCRHVSGVVRIEDHIQVSGVKELDHPEGSEIHCPETQMGYFG